MHATATSKAKEWRRNKRAGQHRGILGDAKILGVDRATLFRVLTGRTRNPRLLSRYKDLVKLRSQNTTTEKHDQ